MPEAVPSQKKIMFLFQNKVDIQIGKLVLSKTEKAVGCFNPTPWSDLIAYFTVPNKKYLKLKIVAKAGDDLLLICTIVTNFL